MSNQIEGKNSILEALKTNHPIDKILISKDIGRHSTIAEILHLSKQKGVPLIYLEKSKLDNISKTKSHQGIIAYVPEKEYVEVTAILLS